MPDSYYPSVDVNFIEDHVRRSGKLADNGIVRVGATTTFILAGSNAIYRRSIFIRELEPGQVCLEQATALAVRFSFIGALMEWLETNRSWKEGAYIMSNT